MPDDNAAAMARAAASERLMRRAIDLAALSQTLSRAELRLRVDMLLDEARLLQTPPPVRLMFTTADEHGLRVARTLIEGGLLGLPTTMAMAQIQVAVAEAMLLGAACGVRAPTGSA